MISIFIDKHNKIINNLKKINKELIDTSLIMNNRSIFLPLQKWKNLEWMTCHRF